MATSLIGYNKSAAANNTHIIYCDSLNRRCHYCICVNFLRAVEEKRIGESFADCQSALRKGECYAARMRKEEKKAGEALYYTPREKKVPAPVTKPEFKPVYRSPSRKVEKPKPKPVEKDELVGANMAEVITEAVRVEKEEKSSLIKPRKGESLMGFALRYRALNA